MSSSGLDGRENAKGVWTGTEVLIFGGARYEGMEHQATFQYTDGMRYDPKADAWKAMADAPLGGLIDYPTVWTGKAAIVGRVALYDPVDDEWTSLLGEGPDFGSRTMVWTGEQVVYWGGEVPGDPCGGTFVPDTNTWSELTEYDAEHCREYGHALVWTGDRMIVWGGVAGGQRVNTGAAYDPKSGSWSPVSTAGAPSPRSSAVVGWTGSEMIVWSGRDENSEYLNNGGIYNPSTDTWRSIASPSPENLEQRGTFFWAEDRALLWGTFGVFYDVDEDSWARLSEDGYDVDGRGNTVVWTGTELVVWGANQESRGARYRPSPKN